jgi:DNA-binding transcriptional ArsR family regulator
VRTHASKNRGVKEKILDLRQEGHSYDSIVKEVKVSKSTVSYHLGKGQKEKTLGRQAKRKEGVCGKVHAFIYNPRKPYNAKIYKLGPIRKKARGFVYGVHILSRRASYEDNKKKLKHPNQKVWAYIGKVFPGIKSEKDNVQAVNQWTGDLDQHEGKPLMFPYMRCKISGDIYNAKGSDIQADHIDGDRLNNHISNFSFVHSVCNYMKGQMSYKQLYEKICKIKTNLEKYKEFWNGQGK